MVLVAVPKCNSIIKLRLLKFQIEHYVSHATESNLLTFGPVVYTVG